MAVFLRLSGGVRRMVATLRATGTGEIFFQPTILAFQCREPVARDKSAAQGFTPEGFF